MNNRQLTLALLFGVLIGCATSHITRTAPANAQPMTQPVGSEREWRECVMYGLDYDGDLEDLAANAKPIQGWIPVGGFQAGVVLCR